MFFLRDSCAASLSGLPVSMKSAVHSAFRLNALWRVQRIRCAEFGLGLMATRSRSPDLAGLSRPPSPA